MSTSQSRVMTRGRSGAALSVEVVTDNGVERSRSAVADAAKKLAECDDVHPNAVQCAVEAWRLAP